MVFETTKQSMAWMEHALQTSLKRNALSMEDKMAAGDLGCATNYGWENFRRTVCIHEALVQQKKRKTITTCTNHSVYYTLFYLHYERFQSKLGLAHVLTTAFVSFSWKTGGIPYLLHVTKYKNLIWRKMVHDFDWLYCLLFIFTCVGVLWILSKGDVLQKTVNV